ncbi:hypothetical protein STEG23_000798, partial [Scotinomys teguina]
YSYLKPFLALYFAVVKPVTSWFTSKTKNYREGAQCLYTNQMAPDALCFAHIIGYFKINFDEESKKQMDLEEIQIFLFFVKSQHTDPLMLVSSVHKLFSVQMNSFIMLQIETVASLYDDTGHVVLEMYS